MHQTAFGGRAPLVLADHSGSLSKLNDGEPPAGTDLA